MSDAAEMAWEFDKIRLKPESGLLRQAGSPLAGAPLVRRWLRSLEPGQPLDPASRSRAESWFGRDLGDVRIHDGNQAAELARKLGAEALAIRSHIFGPAEKMTMDTPQGRGLLAHEIAHVVQQTQPRHLSQHSDETTSVPPVNDVSGRGGRQPGPGWLSGVSTTVAHHPTVQRKALPSLGRPDDRISLRITSEALQKSAEDEAQAVEEFVAKAGQREAKGERVGTSNRVDPNELASRVYRMMSRELILERERGAIPT